MQRPACKTEDRQDATFCRNCGVSLGLVCPQCGRGLAHDSEFCDKCGAELAVDKAGADTGASHTFRDRLQRLDPKGCAERLLATRGRVTKEPRAVTMLFSDVKGSTTVVQHIGPED